MKPTISTPTICSVVSKAGRSPVRAGRPSMDKET
jgi:hypothetical protein